MERKKSIVDEASPRGKSRPRVQRACLMENRKKATSTGWRDGGEEECGLGRFAGR